jgi:hypothetical protein
MNHWFLLAQLRKPVDVTLRIAMPTGPATIISRVVHGQLPGSFSISRSRIVSNSSWRLASDSG